MKNKMAKIAFISLSIVFVFSACMTVFAVTTKTVTENQNGIEATLNFNKQEYNANEEVEVTLNVKNNNSYAVKNIQTELIVPSTIKLATGSLKQEVFSLNAGESKVQEVALEKVVETSNEPTTNSPQTGDNVVVYIAMMVISAVALVVISVKKKWIHKKKVMSLVLCLSLVGAMTLTSVVNANVAVKDFTVEGTIKYDGEDVLIKGKVTYDYEVYSKVQIDGVDKGMYAEGNTVTITAEDAPEGKHFAGWTVVKGNVTLADANSSTTTFVMGKEEVEIKANYEVNTYTITSSANEGGTITESATVNYGGSKTFTITPNTGYHIEKVEVDGQDKGTNNTYTFTDVKDNHTINAIFAINPYTITATAGANGTITESARLNTGDSKTFTMTANSGYGVKDVKVDGTSVGPVTSYTFENVNGNHTIEVEFDEATIVTTDQQFRDAVEKGGIIILANDITLEDKGNVEISKNVIIHGGGHTIIGQRYEGVSYSRGAFVNLIGNAKTEIENCNFDYSGKHAGGLNLSDNSEAEIFGGDYSRIFTGGSSNLIIHYGNFTELEMNAYSKVNIYGGVYGQKNKKSWDYSLGEPFSSITISLHGGTYYFDPTSYLDTDKYKATKTQDADNVDIWVVTEK